MHLRICARALDKIAVCTCTATTGIPVLPETARGKSQRNLGTGRIVQVIPQAMVFGTSGVIGRIDGSPAAVRENNCGYLPPAARACVFGQLHHQRVVGPRWIQDHRVPGHGIVVEIQLPAFYVPNNIFIDHFAGRA